MTKALTASLLLLLLTITGCQKCQQCKQYCAYCKHPVTKLVQKTCSSSEVNRFQVDSFKNVFIAAGYDCTIHNEDQKVCDLPSKLNDATNYYVLQDYYCYPVQ